MKEPILIREGHADDMRAILDLEAQFPSDRMSARSVRDFLLSRSSRVLIATRGNENLGNLILLLPQRWRTARIYSVVVAPAARGIGIGSRLVQAAEAIAREAGREGVTLEVRVDNAAARALYEKLGYTLERELPGFYEDGADGLRLGKSLQAAPG
jgi:ribosomal-protein-alanine N-acetyltransferase